MRRKLKNGQPHICAALFLSGLLLMIGKAGACDLGAGLCEVMPGTLLGLGMMAAGVYGLWLVDIKKSAGQARRVYGRDSSACGLRMTAWRSE